MALISNVTAGSTIATTWGNAIRDATVQVCTSGTRPTAAEGKVIYETDTDKIMVYNGTDWIRVINADKNGGVSTSGTLGGYIFYDRDASNDFSVWLRNANVSTLYESTNDTTPLKVDSNAALYLSGSSAGVNLLDRNAGGSSSILYRVGTTLYAWDSTAGGYILSLATTGDLNIAGAAEATHHINRNRIGCTLRRTADQSINTDSRTDITWPTEDVDSSGFYAPTSATITVPTGLGGLYSISAVVSSGTNFPTSSMVGLVTGVGTTQVITSGASSNSNAIQSISSRYWMGVSATLDLAAGDTVKAYFYHNYGSAINVQGRITMYRVLC